MSIRKVMDRIKMWASLPGFVVRRLHWNDAFAVLLVGVKKVAAGKAAPDPAQLSKEKLLRGWEQMCKAAGHPEGMTVLEAQRLLESEMQERCLEPSKQMKHEDFLEAVCELSETSCSVAPDSAQIGDLLRSCRNRIFLGRRIVCTQPDQNPRGRIWTVERIIADGGAS